MLRIKQSSAVKRPGAGTPGSSAVERGFDVEIATEPSMAAYRVAIVWTPDGWRTTNHTEAHLVNVQGYRDLWKVEISYYTTPPTTFNYALVAAGPDGQVWDNNAGWNYVI